MIQPKCSICQKDLMDNEGYVEKDGIKTLVEAQVYYFAHDPRNLHADIPTRAHESCFKIVKEKYPNFDNPVEDYDSYKVPVIDSKGEILLKTPDKFKSEMDAIHLQDLKDAEEKLKVLNR